MGCCGSTSVNIPATPAVPAPTADEAALTKSQADLYSQNLDILKQQQADQQATRTAFETATGMPYADYLAQTAKTESDINTAYSDRIQKGLAGTLPVDPSMEASLEQQSATLDEQYLKQLGPGYKTSTPYQEARAKFNQTSTGLRTAAQTGSITEGEQLGYASPTSLTSPSSQLTSVGQIGQPAQTGSLYDYYLGQQRLQNQNLMAGYGSQVSAANAGATSSGALLSGGMGLLGQLGGSAIQGYFS